MGSTKPKRLWLPTIIENADEITVVVYSALSQRQLSPDQVEKFKSKYEGDYISHTDRGDFICTPTGRDYKIRVEYEGTVTYYPFSEWVICLCKNNKLPEVKNIKNKGRL